MHRRWPYIRSIWSNSADDAHDEKADIATVDGVTTADVKVTHDGGPVRPSRPAAIAVALGLAALLALLGVLVFRSMGSKARDPKAPLAYPEVRFGTRVVEYKLTEKRPLHLHLFETYGAPTSAVLFFHGGGFNQTPLGQFQHQAEALQAEGVLAILVEYRVAWDGASFPEASEDARDAVGWIRAHAADFHLNPGKIAVAGVAVGGWLAASTEGQNEPSRANALILIDPALGGSLTAPSAGNGGSGVPTLILHGDNDKVNPTGASRKYCDAAKTCQLIVMKDADQGYFNQDKGFPIVLDLVNTFLRERKYLPQ